MYKDEPFATLEFGGVKIKVPYTLFRSVKMDNESINFAKPVSLFSRGIEEIIKEMEADIYGVMPPYHRDSEEFKSLPMSHNAIHPSNQEISIKDDK